MQQAMRLKTKLVLAITALVFLIAGLVSLVYVHQLVKAAVQQTYDTNRMVAEQVRFALQNALESGPRGPHGRSQQSGRTARAGGRDGAQRCARCRRCWFR